MVNHEDKKIYVNGNPVIVKRGSKLTSIVKLADRWCWSRCRALRYLNSLEADNMIKTKRTSNGTTITVVNYDFYNSTRTANDTSNDTANDTPNDTAVDTQTNNYKNTKENIENKRERVWPLYDNRGVRIEE
jgi:DNA replication protein DnaD